VPSWLVAILVALVGLAAGVLGTYVRIVHERSTDIRTRMLDAADAFVTAMTAAADELGTAALRVGLWVHISRAVGVDAHLAEREGEAEAAHEEASSAWSAANQRVPRIGLLFGVDDPAALLAVRAADELGEAVIGLARLRSEAYDSELGEDELSARNEATIEDTHRRLASTRDLMAEFSRAARMAIVGRPPWHLLARPRATAVRDSCEADAATHGDSPTDGPTESG
jgi:hypothetical protein